MSTDAHTQAVVVAALARIGPSSVAEIAFATGESDTAVRRALRALERSRLASRPRSHGPWSLVGAVASAVAAGPVSSGDLVYRRADGAVAAATKAESNDRLLDMTEPVADTDLACTGRERALEAKPWWYGNQSTRKWWEAKRLRECARIKHDVCKK